MSPSVPGLTSASSSRKASSALPRLLASVITALAVAFTGLVGAAPASAGGMWPPHDPFYAAPVDLASRAPGEVIRARSTRIKLGPNIQLPFKTYQVLYRTTDRSETPIATVATIIVPTNSRPATDRKLVSYQTAYDGLGPGCRPSYSLQTGKVALQGAEVILMMNMLRRGWTIVTSDYEGPNDSWGVAATTARGVLDGIRAAESYEPAGLDQGVNTKVGMMGYSGGGNASAWANEYAPGYAPELNIVGAAYGGVGGDLGTIVRSLDGELYAGIAFAGIVGVTSAYPDLDMNRFLNAKGKSLFKKLKSPKMACISDFFLSHPFQKFRSYTTVPDILNTPEFKAIGEENKLGRWAPKAPTLWYHTYFDEMGSWWVNQRVARDYCKAGTPVSFQTSYIEEHALQAVLRPWDAQKWIDDRFKGRPFKPNCPTTETGPFGPSPPPGKGF
ncbi:MAG: hypothetical protein JHD16_05940 [Solirubrobacteraceae bacterium]|nr:hypothetical protein [Solirubrobacteraceae bacterium]